MTSELDLHAYIFAGNALNYLVDGGADLQALDSSQTALLELYAAVHPLTPAAFLSRIAELPAPLRALLERCCRWCIANLGADFDPLMGISEPEASHVLNSLSSRPNIP